MAIVRARLGRYAQWQLRDYVIGPGGITLLFVLLLIWLTASTRSMQGGEAHRPPLDWLVTFVAILGSIFATTGLVSDDRSRNYYRFLFAKPMEPLGYYGQAFVLRGIVVVVIAAFVAAVATVITFPISVVGAIIYTAIFYVFVGGITICQSTVWRFAWAGSLGMFLVSKLAALMASPQTGVQQPWRTVWIVLHWVLPPFPQQDRMASLLSSAPQWDAMAGPIAWCLGYGILALMAAALVIKGLEWGR
ncbi:MAG TPA: hypothetical protein VFA43_17315 [Gemmatimonadaceae bacterium]|nr:hypothetical protein [Gemmatimonadaceae bacterium]